MACIFTIGDFTERTLRSTHVANPPISWFVTYSPPNPPTKTNVYLERFYSKLKPQKAPICRCFSEVTPLGEFCDECGKVSPRASLCHQMGPKRKTPRKWLHPVHQVVRAVVVVVAVVIFCPGLCLLQSRKTTASKSVELMGNNSESPQLPITEKQPQHCLACVRRRASERNVQRHRGYEMGGTNFYEKKKIFKAPNGPPNIRALMLT